MCGYISQFPELLNSSVEQSSVKILIIGELLIFQTLTNFDNPSLQPGQWVPRQVTQQLRCGETEFCRFQDFSYTLIESIDRKCFCHFYTIYNCFLNVLDNVSLQICESNALSPYWPTNGVQCNAYSDWLEVRDF